MRSADFKRAIVDRYGCRMCVCRSSIMATFLLVRFPLLLAAIAPFGVKASLVTPIAPFGWDVSRSRSAAPDPGPLNAAVMMDTAGSATATTSQGDPLNEWTYLDYVVPVVILRTPDY